MAHHEVSEEDMDCLHDGGWDDLRACVIPVEVQ